MTIFNPGGYILSLLKIQFELSCLCFHFRCYFICRCWYSRTAHLFETLVILTVELYGSSRQMKMFEQTKSVMMCWPRANRGAQDSIEQTWTVFGISKISSSDVLHRLLLVKCTNFALNSWFSEVIHHGDEEQSVVIIHAPNFGTSLFCQD